jgi:membrane-associated protease RseP (regulator of RpoE activity)
MKFNILRSLAISIALFSTLIFATQQASPEVIEEVKSELKSSLAKLLEYERSNGKDMSELNLVVEINQEYYSNIGLTLDIDNINKQKGAKVLSVAPESTANEIGVMSGDLVTSINGNQLSTNNISEIIKRLSKAEENSKLTIQVIRNGKKQLLEGKIKYIAIPNAKLIVGDKNTDMANNTSSESQCGRIREPFITPKLREDIHSARIQSIDGEDQPKGRDIFKLKPGLHVVGIHEFISDYRVKRKKHGIQFRKYITINIEPNTTYYVGAKFLPNKRLMTKDEQYWEPTVWKEVNQPCEL